MVPLDTLGQVDDNGKIVFLSVGMSNAFEEFGQFMNDAALQMDLAPRLEPFNGAKGGTPIEDMRSPSHPYWDGLDSQLLAAGLPPTPGAGRVAKAGVHHATLRFPHLA